MEDRVRGFGFTKGYLVQETDEKVNTIGRRFLNGRAYALALRHRPEIPSYHLRIEKVGFLLYEVSAYQNLLTKAPAP
jgi:hypothetical protein